MVFTAIAVVMSETASNTAAAKTIIVPTAIAVSRGRRHLTARARRWARRSSRLRLHDAHLDSAKRHRLQRRLYSARRRDGPCGLLLDIVGCFVVVAGVLLPPADFSTVSLSHRHDAATRKTSRGSITILGRAIFHLSLELP